jgi:DNA polymerase-3 subunit epsilon/ATP-dependent DNA helicase DinG
MRTLVALDLETTGLDPERDAVIEIGAIRFRGSRAEAEWSTLVNPGRPVPPFISELTGIDDSQVARAPRLSSVLPTLAEFVGNLPVLGHNIAFDLSFLRPYGLLLDNRVLDTYDLASVILPAAGRYRLDALASALGVPSPDHHRALPDARTTMLIYQRLCQRLRELPRSLVEEIVRLGEDIEWGAGWAFEEALEGWPAENAIAEPAPPAAEIPPPPPLEPKSEPQPLDVENLTALLEPGGAFAKKMPGYEHRSQQVEMLRAVAQAIASSDHLLVEAGTGTGKSLAYLLPALAWAEGAGRRVLVSTNTINLQDQLLAKDVPLINRVLEKGYRAAALKGRGNYLCPRRLDAMRHLGPRTPAEMRVLAKTLVWLACGGSGDRQEINLNGPEEAAIWGRLSADHEQCNPEACRLYGASRCPYFRARQQAEAAHVVIVNHALLLADIATGNRVIPEYDHLIVDEAHHLESATTNGLATQLAESDLRRMLGDLGSRPGGLFPRTLRTLQKALPRERWPEAVPALERALKQVQEARSTTAHFFASLAHFLSDQREDKPIGRYGQTERILPSTRTLPGWTQVEVAWENLRLALGEIQQAAQDAADLLLSGIAGEEEPSEDLALELRGAARSLAEAQAILDQMIFDPDPKTIYWIELSAARERISLHAAPLEVGHLVERHLWHDKESVIMTSATLTTAGEFDYIRQRLNAYDAKELYLDSPFDFEHAVLLYLPTDMPEPSDHRNYQRATERTLIDLCRATEGRTLVLFTSYDQLRRTSRSISEPLARQGILVLEQGEGASRHALLEHFRTTDKAVLLGTRSFWEGVDVPGPALSVLVIARLPFDVPNDPIIAARAETYESPFDQYMLPEAILRFRQGFGRLIRSRSDRGVVVLLDRRVSSKAYGRAFLESLPNCTVRNAPLHELPGEAARWLGL